MANRSTRRSTGLDPTGYTRAKDLPDRGVTLAAADIPLAEAGGLNVVRAGVRRGRPRSFISKEAAEVILVARKAAKRTNRSVVAVFRDLADYGLANHIVVWIESATQRDPVFRMVSASRDFEAARILGVIVGLLRLNVHPSGQVTRDGHDVPREELEALAAGWRLMGRTESIGAGETFDAHRILEWRAWRAERVKEVDEKAVAGRQADESPEVVATHERETRLGGGDLRRGGVGGRKR